MPDLGLPPPVSLSSDLLLGNFQAASALRFASTAAAQTAAARARQSAPDTSVPPPWESAAKPLGQEEILNKALATGEFFHEDLESFSDTSAPEDQKKLFALYQGLRRLSALSIEAADKDVLDSRRSLMNKKLLEGITQLDGFLERTDFEELSFLKGEKSSTADSTLSLQRNRQDYVTGVIHEGEFDDEISGFTGDVQFTVTAKKITGDIAVSIDLSEMGATIRTLDNVADHINTKLDAAGLYSTFVRVKIGEEDENGIVQGNRFGYKIEGTDTEPLHFSPASASAAVYTVGISGTGENATARLAKFDAEAASAPELDLSTRLEAATDANTEFVATRTGPNGEIYAIAKSDGVVAGLTPRGSEDVYLIRYDSAGKQVYTRALGAVDEVEVHDLAVGSDGSVVIAGEISGILGDTTELGGKDSFVLSMDSAGKENFIKRFGVGLDDRANALAVASDGTIYVAGSTKAALSGSHAGGEDVYVRALDSTGTTLYTRQFGSADDDVAKAMAIDANGDLLLASLENGEGKLRRFPSANDTDPFIWEHDLGSLDSGTISSMRVDGNAIIIGGSAGAGHALGAATLSHSGDKDGFLLRVDDDGSGTAARTWTTFLGTSETDRIEGVDSANGKLYATGLTAGSLPGGGVLDGTLNSFVSRFDLASGALEGSTQLTGYNGKSSAAAMTIDASGTSVLDAFGLPRGAATTSDSRVVTERSSAREGDRFQLSIDGGLKRTIRVEADDTYRSLTFKINALLVLDGKAEVKRNSDGDTLRISPEDDHVIELFAGPNGRDLLSAIGMPEGVVQQSSLLDNDETSSSAPPVYGLGINSKLGLQTLTQATAARELLDTALAEVRDAYRALTQDPALQALLDGEQGPGKRGGTVPAYLNAQLANYTAGLNRLSGGTTGGVF